MNKQLEQIARDKIKEGLADLPDGWQDIFRRMYGEQGQDINDVVDQMPADKLDWALTQVENSLDKLDDKE